VPVEIYSTFVELTPRIFAAAGAPVMVMGDWLKRRPCDPVTVMVETVNVELVTPYVTLTSLAVMVVVEMFVQVQPPLVSVPVTVRFRQFTSVNFVAAALTASTKAKPRRKISRYFLSNFTHMVDTSL